MNPRAKVLKQLVGESLYVVDESAIAEAIILRSMLRSAVPELPFRSNSRGPQVRSFRRHDDARSFRLTGSVRLRSLHT